MPYARSHTTLCMFLLMLADCSAAAAAYQLIRDLSSSTLQLLLHQSLSSVRRCRSERTTLLRSRYGVSALLLSASREHVVLSPLSAAEQYHLFSSVIGGRPSTVDVPCCELETNETFVAAERAAAAAAAKQQQERIKALQRQLRAARATDAETVAAAVANGPLQPLPPSKEAGESEAALAAISVLQCDDCISPQQSSHYYSSLSIRI